MLRAKVARLEGGTSTNPPPRRPAAGTRPGAPPWSAAAARGQDRRGQPPATPTTTTQASQLHPATQDSSAPASQPEAGTDEPSAQSRWWLHAEELKAARERKTKAVRARDDTLEITGTSFPLLEAAVAEADSKLTDLITEREAAKPPDRLLREAERDLATAQGKRATHLGTVEKAEGAYQSRTGRS